MTTPWQKLSATLALTASSLPGLASASTPDQPQPPHATALVSPREQVPDISEFGNRDHNLALLKYVSSPEFLDARQAEGIKYIVMENESSKQKLVDSLESGKIDKKEFASQIETANGAKFLPLFVYNEGRSVTQSRMDTANTLADLVVNAKDRGMHVIFADKLDGIEAAVRSVDKQLEQAFKGYPRENSGKKIDFDDFLDMTLKFPRYLKMWQEFEKASKVRGTYEVNSAILGRALDEIETHEQEQGEHGRIMVMYGDAHAAAQLAVANKRGYSTSMVEIYDSERAYQSARKDCANPPPADMAKIAETICSSDAVTIDDDVLHPGPTDSFTNPVRPGPSVRVNRPKQ